MLIRRMKPLGYSLEQIVDLLRALESARSDDCSSTDRENALTQFLDDANERRETLAQQLAAADEFIDQLSSRIIPWKHSCAKSDGVSTTPTLSAHVLAEAERSNAHSMAGPDRYDWKLHGSPADHADLTLQREVDSVQRRRCHVPSLVPTPSGVPIRAPVVTSKRCVVSRRGSTTMESSAAGCLRPSTRTING